MSKSGLNNSTNNTQKMKDIQGGEKKVMKKSLSVILSSAMALSMFSSVAFGKTSTDFTDLKDLPADQKVIFDAMISAGIFEGVTDTTFGINDDMNRAQFAKVAAKLLNLNTSATVSSFTDVKASDAANGYAVGAIEALKTAKVTDGVTDTTFDPAGKVTKEQLATFLIRALGKDAEARLTPAVNDDTVSTWAKGYVAFALEAKLIANGANGKFGGTTNATRALLVNASFAAKSALEATQAVSLSSVTATGAKKITVNFNKAVDTSKAVITVSNGTNAVNASKTTFSDDKKSVTLEYPNALAAAEYTVTVKGVATADLTSKVTFEAEKVAKITLNSDKAVLDRADATNKTVYTGLTIANQYGENVTSTYEGSLTFTTSKGTATVSAGKVSINDPAAAFTLDQKVTLSVVHAGTGTFTSAVLTVSNIAQVGTISISSLYNPDGATLVAGSTKPFYLVVDVKDQYGNAVAAGDIANDVIVTPSNPAVANVANVFSTVSVNGTNKTVLALQGPFTAGTSSIVIISKTTGGMAKFDVVVKDIAKVDSLTLSAPTIAVANETVKIPFTAVDQFGAAVTSASVLAGVNISTTYGNIAFKQDAVTNTAYLELVVPSSTTDKTAVITAITSTNKVAQLTVNVMKDAKPVVITGIKDIATNIAKTGIANLTKANIVVQDQYGRDFSSKLALSPTGYRVLVASSDTSKVTPQNKLGAATVTGTTYFLDTTNVDNVVFTGTAKGSSSVTLKLQLWDSVSSTYKDVANSSYVYNASVVEKADIASYEVADIATLYDNNAGTAYDKAITVNGVLADGTKVAVPVSYYTVTLATYLAPSALNDANTYKIHADTSTNAAAFYGTASDKDVTVIVTVAGATGPQVITKTVKVSKAAPTATTLSLVTNGVATVEDATAKLVSVTAANIASGVQQLVQDTIKTVDQYGVELTGLSEPTYTVIVTNISDSTKTINGVDGATTTTVAATNTFNVTAITGTQVVSFKVVVK